MAAPRVFTIEQGGTGLATLPALNEILIGDGTGAYVLSNVSSVITGVADAIYLRLDATNDPLTGTLDTQIVEPSSDNTYTLGIINRAWSIVYSRGLSIGNAATLPTLANYNPVVFDYTINVGNRTLNSIRAIAKNTANAVGAGATAVYARGDFTSHDSLVNAVTLTEMNLTGVVSSGGIYTLQKLNYSNDKTGGITGTLQGSVISITGASGDSVLGLSITTTGGTSNRAIFIQGGDVLIDGGGGITIDSNLAGSLVLGEGQNAQIGYDGTDLLIDSIVVGSGFINLKGNVKHNADNTYDIGTTLIRTKNFYIAGSLSDGSISVTVANIFDKSDASSQVDGNVIIDNTDSAAFLVRKNAAGGNVFNVDTSSSMVTVTGDITMLHTALGNTFSDATGLRLQNTTAATSGGAQLSPALIFEGYGFKTGAASGSKKAEGAIMMVPNVISSASGVAQQLSFFNSREDGTYMENLRLAMTRSNVLYNTISGDGTFAVTVYPLSIQSSATETYMEILNGAGTGKGAFFGIAGSGVDGDSFELYNYQGGPIDFYTDTAASSSPNVRMRIANTGEVTVQTGKSTTDFANVGGIIFDHFADANNSGTSETDLYTDTLSASTLGTNGDKVVATYQGIFTGAAAATQQLRVYFGGTQIYDSGALSIGAATNNWTVNVVVIRESSSVVRCAVYINSDFATLFPYSTYTRITGLTLSNTQILKITGTAAGAGGASNQITAKLGYLSWLCKA